MKTILTAVADQKLCSVEEIGKALRVGTNCGSCRPALAKMLTETPTSPSLEAAE
jgi:assimilatory nitrate reductase catalytic subunit